MVQLLQINLHHSKAASAALLFGLATGNTDVVLIQEPWIVGSNICVYQPPYTSYFTPRIRITRTCILTKTHFNTFLIPQFSEGDLTTVRLEINENTHHTIASYYLAHDYDGPLPNTTTQQLIHTQWRSTKTNERGELLYDYILQSNLFICNKGNDPTFITRNRREVLDITLI